MIAYCGLNCLNCSTFLATRNDDHALREKTAVEWSKMFGALRPEEIVCDGCPKDDARLFGFCEKCEIRSCARDKGVDNCAQCQDSPCGKMEAVFALDPDIRKAFEKIRAGM